MSPNNISWPKGIHPQDKVSGEYFNGETFNCVLANTVDWSAGAKSFIVISKFTEMLKQPTTAAVILAEMGQTYAERNRVYGSNFKMVGPMMKILFPNGIPEGLVFTDQFHLFELILVKLSRFAISNLTHIDSVRDSGVYSAMIEAILQNKKEGE